MLAYIDDAKKRLEEMEEFVKRCLKASLREELPVGKNKVLEIVRVVDSGRRVYGQGESQRSSYFQKTE